MSKFKTEVSESRIFATNFDPGRILTASTLVMILFCWSLGAYAVFEMLPLLKSLTATRSFDLWSWLIVSAMLVFGIRLLWEGLRQMFPLGESLECDDKTLTISRIPSYVLTGKWKSESFPIDLVKDVSFATLRISRYGGTNGLAFFVNGKKKKVLYGLESPEASEILQGLTKLGVNTIHDPGMPMMVEMALERRKSRFGF